MSAHPCAWCATTNQISDILPTTCRACGHRADTSQKNCDCRDCNRRLYRPLTAKELSEVRAYLLTRTEGN